MKVASVLAGTMALLPGLAWAGGEAHAFATIHSVYARSADGTGSWQPLAPERALVGLSSMNSYDVESEFAEGPDGLQGRSLGPFDGATSTGMGRVSGQSSIVRGSKATYAWDDLAVSSQFSEPIIQYSAASQGQEFTFGDFAQLGFAGGSRADLYTQIDLRAGSGFNLDSDGHSSFDLGVYLYGLTKTKTGYAFDASGRADVGATSGYDQIPFDPSAGGSVSSSAPAKGHGAIEFYLLGDNADDTSVAPEDRWTSSQAVRLDTLSSAAANSLIASYFNATGTVTRDIHVGVRYRDLLLPSDGAPSTDVLFFDASVGAGKPTPEPAPCLALGLGAVALLRRRKARP